MKSVVLHGITALGGLLLAYSVWVAVDTPERSGDAVTLFVCDPDDVSEISLRDDEGHVVVSRRESDPPLFWVDVSRHPEEGEATEAQFVGGEGIEALLAAVAPLDALRGLGAIEGETLAELALAEGEASRLKVTCGERALELDVGGVAYGTGNRYVRRHGEDEVYLVGAATLRSLETAEFQLMQRALHTFEDSDVVELVVTVDGATRRLMQRGRFSRPEWVDAENPDRRNELYGNWVGRLVRLRAQSYLAPDTEPGAQGGAVSAAPVPVVRLAFRGEGDSELGSLELVRVDGEQSEYYARTETTRSWVLVPRSVSAQLEEDARSVVGLEALVRAAPPALEEAPDAGAATPASDGGAPVEADASVDTL